MMTALFIRILKSLIRVISADFSLADGWDADVELCDLPYPHEEFP